MRKHETNSSCTRVHMNLCMFEDETDCYVYLLATAKQCGNIFLRMSDAQVQRERERGKAVILVSVSQT